MSPARRNINPWFSFVQEPVSVRCPSRCRSPLYSAEGVGLEPRPRKSHEACPSEEIDWLYSLEAREVEERAAEAVDLVDDDDVDLARVDVGEQALERGALDVRASEAAVVVALGQRLPALAPHRPDVELGGLALGVEGVEVGLEPLARRLAGVDLKHPLI